MMEHASGCQRIVGYMSHTYCTSRITNPRFYHELIVASLRLPRSLPPMESEATPLPRGLGFALVLDSKLGTSA